MTTLATSDLARDLALQQVLADSRRRLLPLALMLAGHTAEMPTTTPATRKSERAE